MGPLRRATSFKVGQGGLGVLRRTPDHGYPLRHPTGTTQRVSQGRHVVLFQWFLGRLNGLTRQELQDDQGLFVLRFFVGIYDHGFCFFLMDFATRGGARQGRVCVWLFSCVLEGMYYAVYCGDHFRG